MRLQPGIVLGHYMIVSPLGEGGMGEVYRARDLRLRREVAVKLISERLASSSGAVARFRREAESASALNHPYILTIYDFAEATLPDGSQATYIVMEYIDGISLRNLVHDPNRDTAALVENMAQVAEGLAKAHAAGIIHRDLKPDNIMITRDGYAKILDFGLAKLTDPNDDTKPPARGGSSTDLLSPPSAAGIVIGTAGYVSPEQVEGRRADARSDIFAFGSVLYEVLTGEDAFEGDSTVETLYAVLNSVPRLLGSIVPADLRAIVTRCLEKDPDARYQTMAEVATELRRVGRRSDKRVSGVSPSVRRMPNPALLVAGIVIAAAALIALFLATHRAPASEASTAPRIASLAVLPFDNRSADPDLEYLSEGVTDTLLNDLSQVPTLRVMARTTVYRFRGKVTDVRAIGRELDVDAVVVGHVQRDRDHLALSAEMVSCKDGSRLWGARYDGSTKELLELQERVSREIAEKLRARIAPTTTPLHDTTAYDLYLKGRYFWNRRTSESVTKALTFFEEAVRREPDFARAYTGIADCYIAMTQFRGIQRSETCNRGVTAAQRALDIDEGLAEAHTSMGYLDLCCRLDLKGAESEFKRALELNPNYAVAHHWYGVYLTNSARAAESVEQMKIAAKLDPFSTQIVANLAFAEIHAGLAAEAQKQIKEAIDLDPAAPYPYHMRGYIALMLENYDLAAESFQIAVDKSFLASKPFLAYAEARRGNLAKAKQLLDELENTPAYGYNTPALRAGTYALLGDRAHAYRLLDEAIADHDYWMSALRISPLLEPLRGDARFQDLVTAVAKR